METLKLKQGTDDWHAERLRSFTASEAPIAMMASKFSKRNELLALKYSGNEKEYSEWVQRNVFNKGHEAEAAARPHVEKIIGATLWPETGRVMIDGLPFLASFDGLTDSTKIAFEHKAWNETLADDVRKNDLGPHYYWQLEHELLVSGAEKVIFVTSDGTPDKMEWIYYEPVPGRAEELIAGWKQFAEDLKNYQPREVVPEVVPSAQVALPTVSVKVSGDIAIFDNLETFGAALTQYTQGMNMQPETDQDFADLEASAKALKRAEGALSAAEDNALAQTSSIEEMRRTVATYRSLAREFRIKAEKAVKAEKENKRNQIAREANSLLDAHIEAINNTLEGVRLPTFRGEFAAAMKGKKTITSLQSAADDELARMKIEINQAADKIRLNLKKFFAIDADYRNLFPDLNALVAEKSDAFVAIVANRIRDYTQAEERRLEVERERIRQEEAEKLERQQRRKAEEERRIQGQAEERRRQEERRAEIERQEERRLEAEHQESQRANPAEATPGETQAHVASTSPISASLITDDLIEAYIERAGMADRTAVTFRKNIKALVQFARTYRTNL